MPLPGRSDSELVSGMIQCGACAFIRVRARVDRCAMKDMKASAKVRLDTRTWRVESGTRLKLHCKCYLWRQMARRRGGDKGTISERDKTLLRAQM